MINQIGIFIFGVSAILLIGLKDEKLRKWGFVCGLLSQPFWFYTTWKAGQWGIFAMSFVYAYSWANGFRNHFLRRQS